MSDAQGLLHLSNDDWIEYGRFGVDDLRAASPQA